MEDLEEASKHIFQLKNIKPKIYLDIDSKNEILHLKQLQNCYSQSQMEGFLESLLQIQQNQQNVILFSAQKQIDKKDAKKKKEEEVKQIGFKGTQILIEKCKYYLVQDKAEIDEIAGDLFGIVK